MIHYHGTPITPYAALYELAGRHFCVSHARPDQVRHCHEIGQSVMLDNGAFSQWRAGKKTNWAAFYGWVEVWLSCPTTWAVIPDVIDGGVESQDNLLEAWPFGARGVPVWHMDEPLERLLRLCDQWPRVCVGSTAQYATIRSPSWDRRMDETWDAVSNGRRFLPHLHMLRGMQLSGERWPFASVDSTDVARNHSRPQNSPGKMAARWDELQTPLQWGPAAKQLELA